MYIVVARATVTCAAERPKSFATPRKRSGTLSGTSLSGARSTNTLDMLPPGRHAGPTHPWTGPDAQTRPPRARPTPSRASYTHLQRPTERAAQVRPSPPPRDFPLRPSSPALSPRATGRLRSGLAKFARMGSPPSCATRAASRFGFPPLPNPYCKRALSAVAGRRRSTPPRKSVDVVLISFTVP